MTISCNTYRTKLVLYSHCNSLARRSCDLVLSARFAWLFLPFRTPVFLSSSALAQESPYFVAYDHYLEEPGNLEIEYFSTYGPQRGGNNFHAFWTEFEYGATAWWTTEFYLDGQTSFHDSTVFTGFRW